MAYLESEPDMIPLEINISDLIAPRFLDAIKEYNPENIKWEEKLLWIRERDAMAVHISGVMPTALIETRRPNEQYNIWEYRKANYEPTTQPIIQQAIDSLDRIFNAQNYTLILGEKLRAYLDEEEFNGYSFIQWFQQIYKTFILEDPNGLLVCYPGGDGVVDSSKVVEPKLAIINCDAILGIGEKDGAWTSVLYVKENKCSAGNVQCCYIDEANFIEIEYTAKGQQFNVLRLYPHNLGYLPVKVNGGKWNTRLGIFESFFHSFVPEANQAIREESDHIGSLVTCGHPLRIVEPSPCTAHDCERGWINGQVGVKGAMCGVCGGTGNVFSSSPFGIFVKTERDYLTEGHPDKNESDPVRFISPPTEPLKFQQESLQRRLNNAKEALHLSFVDEAQSGVAKSIDREREYAKILSISNQIFSAVDFAIYTFERYINVLKPEPYELYPPSVFSIKTIADLIGELKELVGSGSPMGVIRSKTIELLQKQYPGKDQQLEDQLFLMEYDFYYMYQLADKQTMLAQGTITPYEMRKSLQAPTLLEKYHRLNPTFVLAANNYEIVEQWINDAIISGSPTQTRQPLMLPYNPKTQISEGEEPENTTVDLTGSSYDNNGGSQITAV